MSRHRAPVYLAVALIAVLAGAITTGARSEASHPGNDSHTYTVDADFDLGTLINVDHTPSNQLQLDDTTSAFAFIWVAASGNGTIVKIDTVTGVVLGEYQSAPDGRGRNPSRTTVDANGNVWAGNRNESSGGQGSVVQVGLEENGQCVDRNNNGVIDTSTGLGDVRTWLNGGGVDNGGGVTTALDECIIKYVRVAGNNVRHVSVDGNNNVWTAGNGDEAFDLVDGSTGAILASFDVNCGGYGGLVDGNGVLWSASRGPSGQRLLRYDTNNTITTADDSSSCIAVANSYGLGIDNSGNIWHSQWTTNNILKFTPAGVLVGGFPVPTGGTNSRGVAATADGDIWIANSGSNTVTRLNNSGALVATIAVGGTPTGVSVDAAGKVWVTNLGSNNAMRINPATNTVDATVGVGAGSSPYNYSDMTGSTITAAPTAGTWTIVHDSGVAGADFGNISWSESTPSDSSITVTAAMSTDASCTSFGASFAVTDGVDFVGVGKCVEVSVSFARATTGETPILFDLTIEAFLNDPPDCSSAEPSVELLWPANHKFVEVNVLGVTDPDLDPVTINIDSIWQDEPVSGKGAGSTTPDGQGVGSDTAEVRAERSGSKKVPGDGRVYHIAFTADDGNGATCSGEVTVGVPHDQRGDGPVDGGLLYDSTLP